MFEALLKLAITSMKSPSVVCLTSTKKMWSSEESSNTFVKNWSLNLSASRRYVLDCIWTNLKFIAQYLHSMRAFPSHPASRVLEFSRCFLFFAVPYQSLGGMLSICQLVNQFSPGERLRQFHLRQPNTATSIWPQPTPSPTISPPSA